MSNRSWKIYLSGETHSGWREEIKDAIDQSGLSITCYEPQTHHGKSDKCAATILEREDERFWYDHSSAKLNSIRNMSLIKDSDLVIVKFGEKYKQWNAAFDAGICEALAKKYIVIHPDEFTHALKEVDSGASLVCNSSQQAVDALKYIVAGELDL